MLSNAFLKRTRWLFAKTQLARYLVRFVSLICNLNNHTINDASYDTLPNIEIDLQLI